MLLAGCGARSTGPVITSSDRKRIEIERAEREQLLATLRQVSPNEKRTSKPSDVDILAVAPELKSRIRQTVQLHPRFSDEPAPDESKIGGRILWPSDELWPTCEKYRIPLVAVLQLRQEDAPSQLKYRDGTDLLQLLWSPRDHGEGGPKSQLFWRKRANIAGVTEPNTEAAFMNYVPVPCRLFPERVLEFPDWSAIPASLETRAKLEQAIGQEKYESARTAAVGNKAGGYPVWRGNAQPPSCDTCKWGMDYLLTIANNDFDDAHVPVEEEKLPREGYSRATGLKLPGSGVANVYICRRCQHWPIKIA